MFFHVFFGGIHNVTLTFGLFFCVLFIKVRNRTSTSFVCMGLLSRLTHTGNLMRRVSFLPPTALAPADINWMRRQNVVEILGVINTVGCETGGDHFSWSEWTQTISCANQDCAQMHFMTFAKVVFRKYIKSLDITLNHVKTYYFVTFHDTKKFAVQRCFFHL